MNKQTNPLDAIRTSYNDTQQAYKHEARLLAIRLLCFVVIGFILIRLMGV